ncbi:MAG TPA: formate dehydrogenase accessory sulfurtransferase FdhD [Dehalococcoidia bacterium]|nr:formate dehydrogenase accessory sulfurtransferase FdhD [Dehalococcoidia bacterium]
MITGLKEVKIQRISGQHNEVDSDVVISETEVLLRVNGADYRAFYCLPTQLEQMARGYLISAGICNPPGIKEIRSRWDGNKHLVEASIAGYNTKPNQIKSQMRICITDILEAERTLNEHSVLFSKTGGTHIATILSKTNSVFAEDTSRHCAIDKAIGLATQRSLNLNESILAASCRQTASTIRKAIYCQIPVVISTSAVTSLAIRSACKYGVTLIGFAREHRFNVYSHKERISGID